MPALLAVGTAVESVLHNPRVEDFGNHLFITVRGIDYTVESELLQTTELNLFLGSNYVVSNHNIYMPSVEAITKLVELDGRPMMHGPSFLLHALLDAMIGNIFPTLDRLSERADDIEEEILRNPHQSALEALLALKRSSLRLRRTLTPQREVLSRLGRREFKIIGEDADLYFRDIFEDLVRIEGGNDVLRERADTAMSIYLSAVANRQNEVMKALSVVATVFMPLGLIAGIFGMNFTNMPGLELTWIYILIVALTVAAMAGVIWMLWMGRWVVTGSRSLRKSRLPRFIPTAVDPVRLVTYVGHRTGLRRR